MDEVFYLQSARFRDTDCDIFADDGEAYMTRDQIGRALGYVNPRNGVAKVHERHRDRLDPLSRTSTIHTLEGQAYQTVVYTRRGVMEVCRWSHQPQADAFMDFVWEVMDGLVTGRLKLHPLKHPYREVNAAARLLLRSLIAAEVPPRARLSALQNLYLESGLVFLPRSLALEMEHPVPGLERGNTP